VKGRLKYIGDELGVRYAHILAQVRFHLSLPRFTDIATLTGFCVNKLPVRIPSMLIRRDGLMANPYPTAHNFEKLLSARQAAPAAGYTLNPLQQREAMQMEDIEKRRKELIAKATESAGEEVKKVAKKWLLV
jgi:hypothetical protein